MVEGKTLWEKCVELNKNWSRVINLSMGKTSKFINVNRERGLWVVFPNLAARWLGMK